MSLVEKRAPPSKTTQRELVVAEENSGYRLVLIAAAVTGHPLVPLALDDLPRARDKRVADD